MKFLLGSLAHNPHLQNIALALYEESALGAYYSGAVDNYSSSRGRALRALLGRAMPGLDRRLSRRRILTVPDELIRCDRTWDSVRSLAHFLKLGENFKDMLWEHSEHRFASFCARAMKGPEFDVYFGVEYGALEAAQTARELGKRVVVAFLSPHHGVLDEWVFSEYARYPELVTPYVERLARLMPRRTARKDQEAHLADVIHTASRFTANSLQKYAGFDASKMISVPLGAPPAISASELPASPSRPVKFLYSGPVSVRKGAHYLLRAWKLVDVGGFATMDIFGTNFLPSQCFENLGVPVTMHGHVSLPELQRAYTQASVLVFPTLCDGFGMVVQEAFAHGLPVITTSNAGAADLIREGENGFVVPPRDPEALAEVMRWCVTHPAELFKMRPAALETARSWTWKEFRESLKAQLEDRLGSDLKFSRMATGRGALIKATNSI
jgi:glycosyltransferase involved in cell wall biosynthesis